MKFQHFSVIFIIIILPIALVLSVYTGNLISVENQNSLYDSILQNSTYDAVRAYQMNTLQNTYDSETNSKVRDINASVNTFFNSLSLGFSSSGLSKHELTDHVPAMLFTLYDGFYVYGAFGNIATFDGNGNINYSTKTDSSIRRQYGLKPYIYYSCEYSEGTKYDIIVNYTLDNYITVTGTYKDNNGYSHYIAESGYYVNHKKISFPDEKTVSINGVTILPEELSEELITIDEYQIVNGGKIETKHKTVPENGENTIEYKYIVYKGVKYYLDGEHIEKREVIRDAQGRNIDFNDTYDGVPIFRLDRDTRIYISKNEFEDIKNYLGANDDNIFRDKFKDVNAYYYYRNAVDFSKRVEPALKLIDLSKGVVKTDTYNTNYTSESGNETHIKSKYDNSRIFDLDDLNNNPELESSSFNLHRMDVIISSVESSLVSTIANFNKYFGSGFIYTMPVLNENDWYEICNNVTVLSFLQGLTIGNYKYYSSYSLVSNTKVKDFISRNAIYVQYPKANESYEYHNPKCVELNKNNSSSLVGYANIDYDRQVCANIDDDQDDSNNKLYYYYLHKPGGAYECIVGQNSNQFTSDELIKGGNIEGKGKVNDEVRRAYISALARERGISYKTYGFFNNQM